MNGFLHPLFRWELHRNLQVLQLREHDGSMAATNDAFVLKNVLLATRFVCWQFEQEGHTTPFDTLNKRTAMWLSGQEDKSARPTTTTRDRNWTR